MNKLLFDTIEQCKDWKDAELIANIAKHELSTKLPNVNIYSIEDYGKIIESVKNDTFNEYPCVIVTTQVKMAENACSHYNVFSEDLNNVKMRPHSPTDLACLMGPMFNIIASTDKEVHDIGDMIYNNIHEPIWVRCVTGDASEYVPCVGIGVQKQLEKIDVILDLGSKMHFANYEGFINPLNLHVDSIDSMPNCANKNRRIAEIGKYISNFVLNNKKISLGSSRSSGYTPSHEEFINDAIEGSLKQYNKLFKKKGLLQKVGSFFDSKGLNDLKNAIDSGAPITNQLVVNGLPFIATMYPGIQDDLIARVSSDQIRPKIQQKYQEYKKLFNDICNYFGLPETMSVDNQDFSVLYPNIRSYDGFNFMITEYIKEPYKDASLIVDDYKEAVKESAREGLIERERLDEIDRERREERRANGQSGSFIRGVASTAIANHGIEKELKGLREDERQREENRKREKMYEDFEKKHELSKLRAQAHTQAVQMGGSASEVRQHETEILNKMGITRY